MVRVIHRRPFININRYMKPGSKDTVPGAIQCLANCPAALAVPHITEECQLSVFDSALTGERTKNRCIDRRRSVAACPDVVRQTSIVQGDRIPVTNTSRSALSLAPFVSLFDAAVCLCFLVQPVSN